MCSFYLCSWDIRQHGSTRKVKGERKGRGGKREGHEEKEEEVGGERPRQRRKWGGKKGNEKVEDEKSQGTLKKKTGGWKKIEKRDGEKEGRKSETSVKAKTVEGAACRSKASPHQRSSASLWFALWPRSAGKFYPAEPHGRVVSWQHAADWLLTETPGSDGEGRRAQSKVTPSRWLSATTWDERGAENIIYSSVWML